MQSPPILQPLVDTLQADDLSHAALAIDALASTIGGALGSSLPVDSGLLLTGSVGHDGGHADSGSSHASIIPEPIAPIVTPILHKLGSLFGH